MIAAGHHHHSYSAVNHIARGYAFVILGMTSSLFLYAGVLGSWATRLWLPIHVTSVVLMAVGGWWWWRMPPLTANWLRASEQFCLAVLLQAYMIPFVLWWRASPHVPFFAANVLIAIAGVAWLLAMLSAIVAETGHILGDRTLQIEGRIGLWLTPVLILVPLLNAVADSLIFFLNAGLPPALESIRIGTLWPRWTGTAMLFAPVLVLSIAVEARLRCLRAAAWLRESETKRHGTSRISS